MYANEASKKKKIQLNYYNKDVFIAPLYLNKPKKLCLISFIVNEPNKKKKVFVVV